MSQQNRGRLTDATCQPQLGDALFLDFDGTLVGFASRPDGVEPPDYLIPALAAASDALDGALAIVTGRTIEEIDRFLSPLVLPVAGVHGLVRRTAAGDLVGLDVETGQLARITATLEEHVRAKPELLIERKTHGVALHYRQAPTLEDACQDVMDRAVAEADQFHVQRGKFVIEARATGANKGTAIAAFLEEAPFRGRRAVFFGDDVTDEDGFAVVNGFGGLSVKVGDGETSAQERVSGIADVHRWVQALTELKARSV